MGELILHDLNKYISTFNCKNFVETGTGKGNGLKYASSFPFKELISIEIVPSLYKEACEKFSYDPRIKIFQGESKIKIIDILGRLDDNPCLFWLDAHFPGADFQIGSYDDDIPDDMKYPLDVELDTILFIRPDNKDVFIIDDMQLYEPGNYELNADPEFLKKHQRKDNNIKSMLQESHDLKIDYRHQGFLIATPKAKI